MSSTSPHPRSIAVFGLGYVGCVSAACLSDLGHSVIGIDKDLTKVENVEAGRAPFFEPGLEELLSRNRAAGRLRATTNAQTALDASDIALICVGTPSERNGNLSLDQLRRTVDEIAQACQNRQRPLLLAIRSTVFPGTCQEVVMPLIHHLPMIQVVSNPEFLREGAAVKDFLEPSLIVVGGDDLGACAAAAAVYEGLGVESTIVSLRTAEMIKYACNAFHAVKIAFANEIGSLASSLGVDDQQVMRTLCLDTKLNSSAAYLRPGFAFGGSCLPKDLRALNYRANRLDLQLPLLSNVLESNQQHLDRAIQTVFDLPDSPPIAIFGLAFKENTDDLRESPVVNLLEALLGKGRNIIVFDPHIRIDGIYGSNKNFILNSIPHIGRLMVPSLDALLAGCGPVVITQKPAPEVATQLRASGKKILDLAGTGLFL